MISYLSAGKCAGQDSQEQQNTDADVQARIQGRVVAVATEADDVDTAALLHLAGENTCHQQHTVLTRKTSSLLHMCSCAAVKYCRALECYRLHVLQHLIGNCNPT